MSIAALIVGVLLVLYAWRMRAYTRRLRAAQARLVSVASEHDERAAAAALRPHTGHVAPYPVHPPTNGRP